MVNRSRAAIWAGGLLAIWSAATTAVAARFPEVPRLRHLTVAQGLPHDVVRAVAQDRVGFIWLGTEAGLGRFDGTGFDVFRHDPARPGSLAADTVSALLVDSSSRLWVGTWGGGLDQLDSATETFVHHPSHPSRPGSLRDNRITTLYEDRSGILWVGTFTGGLGRLDPGSGALTVWLAEAGRRGSLPDNRIWAVVEDGFGNLWVGTGRGLARLDRSTGQFEVFNHGAGDPGSLPDDEVLALAVDRLGALWVGTARGVAVLDPGRGRFEPPLSGRSDLGELGATGVAVIFSDHNGVIWVGTRDSGLWSINLETLVVSRLRNDLVDPTSLARDNVRALFEDHSGVLWIAMTGGGVDRLDLKPAKFRHVTVAGRVASSPAGRVSALAEDLDGRLWIGTDRGLGVWDEASGGLLDPNAVGVAGALPSDAVQRLLPDRGGILWVGTQRGLARVDPRGRTAAVVSLDSRGGGEASVTALAEAPAGGLWVGTLEGLVRLERGSGRVQRFTARPEDPATLSDSTIQALHVDRRGRLWVGTDAGGLDLLEDQTGIRFTHHRTRPGEPGSLSNNRVWALHEGRDGTMWVGTAAGLDAYEEASRSFRHFATGEGPAGDAVYGILDDADGHLWVATNRGLSHLEPDTGRARGYTASDGLLGGLATPGACLRGADGTMYFGGYAGFSVFHPARVADNPNVPRLVIRSLRSFDGTAFVDHALSAQTAIRLSYRANFFTVRFAALDYTDPERNRYAYRLLGLDQAWVDAGTAHAASYTNVDPGAYTFQVRGSNNDGVWNQAEVQLAITITPPVWGTWWFRTLLVFGVAAAVVGGYKWRERRLVADKRRLEALVADRTRELGERRDQLEEINELVKAINSQHAFADLLGFLLKHAGIIKGVDKALALIWDRETELFRVRAVLGWSLEELAGAELTAAEAQARYTEDADEVFEDVFVASNRGPRAGDATMPHLADWKSMLTMRIRVEDRVEGYLVFDSLQDENAFGNRDLLLLEALREHIRSAFWKTRMLQELQAANEKKNEFLGMAAHDLRSPIGLIQGWASVVMRQISGGRLEPERGLRDLGRIVTVAEQMNRLISELLDISAIESGKLSLRRRPESLAAILAECEQLHARLAADKGIALSVEGDGPLPEVLADRERILEVVTNLLSNALKFTQPGGRVRVWCERVDTEVYTHVEDTGVGLTEEDLRQAFRRFGRLSARPTAGEPSTGLGLAIVKKIVEMHGGRVMVKSQQGVGSTFSFSLPTVS